MAEHELVLPGYVHFLCLFMATMLLMRRLRRPLYIRGPSPMGSSWFSIPTRLAVRTLAGRSLWTRTAHLTARGSVPLLARLAAEAGVITVRNALMWMGPFRTGPLLALAADRLCYILTALIRMLFLPLR